MNEYCLFIDLERVYNTLSCAKSKKRRKEAIQHSIDILGEILADMEYEAKNND